MQQLLAMILAGGAGQRLFPLTKYRAKAAVPFGGRYRIIDFVLSNFINSHCFKVKVLTQYRSYSLNNHIMRGWRMTNLANQYVEPVPAMMGEGRGWFKGSADAIYQNLDIITDEKPKTVAVFGADHIYVIDIRQMLNFHRDRGGEVTVAAIPVPIKEARAFGIIEVDQDSRIIGYEEKPDKPKPIPGQVDMAFASMGNYIFNTTTLIRELEEDAHRDASVHDFSRSIIAKMFKSNQVYAYDFRKNRIPGQGPGEIGYWKDVGTIESYYQASMDLVSVTPLINIHNDSWPIWTPYAPLPPSKFVWSERDRMGYATESLISEGCIISGGQVKRSILAPKVRINSYALLEESILFHNVEIGRHSKIRRTIIDKNVRIPPNTVIGYDRKEDERRFHVSESGIVIVSKGTVISA